MQQPNNNIILCIIIRRALYYEITKLRSLKQALNLHILTFFRVKFWIFAAVNINVCVIWNMETFRLTGVYRDFIEYPAP
jgi:hypothetical protein